MKNYSNKLILTMPHVNDPIFSKSIIYLFNHNENGSMGLIINKPISEEHLIKLNSNQTLNNLNSKMKIYFGGPVSLDMGFVLHDNKYTTKQTIPLSDSISLTSNNKIFKDLNDGNGPEKYKFSIGYSGWSKGQLDDEIQAGDWIVLPAKNKLIFDPSESEKWDNITKEYGFKCEDLSGFSGSA
tara:strand:- start:33 stop:581 length:549 start_codon:yes stop_codon:yes gene_type:complete